MIPPFIRVIPAEVARYGSDAAVVLAHIRYRCKSDGTGRLTDADGVRWWRVSQTDLGHEVGLSRKEIRNALQALNGAFAVKHFPPLTDQSRAYRPITDKNTSDLPESQTGQWADLPESEIGQVPVPNGPDPSPIRATALLIRELEKGEKRADGWAHEPPDVLAVPDFANAPPNNSYEEEPRCHKHSDTYQYPIPPDCRACRDVRIQQEQEIAMSAAAEQAEKAAAAQARRTAIADCRHCDDYGWKAGPDGIPLDPATKCSHQAAALSTAVETTSVITATATTQTAIPLCTACGAWPLITPEHLHRRICDHCWPTINGHHPQPNGNTDTA